MTPQRAQELVAMEQQFTAQQNQDPLLALKQRELDLRAMDINRKEIIRPSTRVETSSQVMTGLSAMSNEMSVAFRFFISKSMNNAMPAKKVDANTIKGAAFAISMLWVVSNRASAKYQGPFA